MDFFQDDLLRGDRRVAAVGVVGVETPTLSQKHDFNPATFSQSCLMKGN